MSEELEERVGLKIDNLIGDHYAEGADRAKLSEIAAKAAIAECFKWQPIETAPKNGVPVLLKCGLVDRLYIGFNVGDGWIQRGSRHVDRPPTHWMPLPSPPQPSSGAETDDQA